MPNRWHKIRMIRHFRQRPSVFISAAFVLPICLCCFAGIGTARRLFPFAAVLAVIAALFVLVIKHFKINFMSSLTLLLCAVIPFGIYLVKCSDEKYEYASEYIGSNITVEGTVYHYEKSEYGYTVYLHVHKIEGRESKRFNVRIMSSGTAAPLLYDTALYKITPKGFQKTYYRPDAVSDYYRSEGIHLDSSGVYICTVRKSTWMLRIVRAIENAMSRALDGLENSALAKALIIGDKSYLDTETSNIFTMAGVSHVLALSGLHIGIILLFIRKLIGLTTCPKRITVIISVIPVLLYILMTGGSYSVMRAGIMAIVSFGAFTACVKNDILNSISIAVTLILMLEPYAVKSLSFQLSCGAVMGIGVFAVPLIKRIRKKFEKYIYSKKWYSGLIAGIAFTAVSSVAVTGAVLMFTLPGTLYYAGDVLPVSFLSNIVIIPLTAPVMVILIISVILCLIPIFPFRDLWVSIFAPIADFVLEYFNAAARFFAELNISAINLSFVPGPALALLLATVLAVMILCKARFYQYLAVFGTVCAVCGVLFGFNTLSDMTEIHLLSDEASSCVAFEEEGETFIYVVRGDCEYAVKAYCSEYGKNVIDGLAFAPRYDRYTELVSGICADKIRIGHIYIPNSDENEAKIEFLISNMYPDIELDKYGINKPFPGGCSITADGAFEKEVREKRFVLRTEFSEEKGDITVIDSERSRKIFTGNGNIHNIKYCKTHIFNITDSKITMRCYG